MHDLKYQFDIFTSEKGSKGKERKMTLNKPDYQTFNYNLQSHYMGTDFPVFIAKRGVEI